MPATAVLDDTISDPAPASGRPRWNQRDAAVLFLLLLEALLLAGGSVLRRPDLVANELFLLGDQGLNIFLAERIAAGETLYADVFSPYGPLPAYLHAAVAGLFGNTISTYNFLLVVLSLVNVGVAYALVRSRASTWIAAVVVGVGLMPSFLIPGSLLGGFTGSPYIPLERGLLLLTALLWRPPSERTLRRSAGIGAILGIWQWVKFGGAVFAGATVILADLIVLATSSKPGKWRSWLSGAAIAAGVFILVEGAGVVLALGILPAEVARDVLWPSYMLEAYSGWVTAEHRWPFSGGLNLLIGQYLTPLVSLAMLVFVLVRSGSPASRFRPLKSVSTEWRNDMRLLLPLLFLLVGLLGYLQQAHIIRQFLWVCVVASAFALKRLPNAARVACVILWIPCLAVNVRAMLLTRPPAELQEIALPGGSSIVASPAFAGGLGVALQIVDSLRNERTDSPAAGGGTVLISPMGAGLHVAYDIPHASRQPWLIAGFVRPYDEFELLGHAGSLAAVVAPVMTREGEPCPWAQEATFSDAFCSRFDPLVGEPIDAGGIVTVYPIARNSSESPVAIFPR